MDGYTLLIVGGLFSVISSLMWMSNATVFKNNQYSSYSWFFANLFVGIGLFFSFNIGINKENQILYNIGADVFLLLSITFVNIGITSFTKIEKNKILLRSLVYLGLILICDVVLRYLGYSYFVSIIVSFYATLLLSLNTYFAYLAITLKNKYLKFFIVFPLFFTCVLSITRLIGLIVGNSILTNQYSGEYTLEVFKLVFLVFGIFGSNCALASIVIASLIKKVQILTTKDFLTKAYNRKYVYEYLEDQEELLKENQIPYSIIVVDLDNFKLLNDKYGHAFGDKTLIESVNVFTREIEGGIVGRIGGEEFCIILPNANLDVAVSITEKIREKLEKNIIELDSIKNNVTASFGVVSCNNVKIKSSEVLRKADEAMYVAKKLGKNRVYYKKLESF